MRVNLAAALSHFAEEAAVEVRVFFRRVIVIAAAFVLVAVEGVEANNRRAVRFFVTVDRVAVERIRNRKPLADDLLQMDRRDVIVVVVGSTAVATELVEFTNEI